MKKKRKHSQLLQEVKENIEVKEIKFNNNQTEVMVITKVLIDLRNKLIDIDLIYNKLKNLDTII